MSLLRKLKRLHLLHLSKPASDRVLYRWLDRQRPTRIVELGVGRAERTCRMLQALEGRRAASELHYLGIDLFEARTCPAEERLTLRDAYRKLKATGMQVRLSPGDPFSSLRQVANTVTGVELVVVAGDQDPASLEKAWFYLPRMLHPQAQIFWEQSTPSGLTLRSLSFSDVEALAHRASDFVLHRAA